MPRRKALILACAVTRPTVITSRLPAGPPRGAVLALVLADCPWPDFPDSWVELSALED